MNLSSHDLTDLIQRLVPLMKGLISAAEKLYPMILAVELYDRVMTTCETTGWLPYRTVPFARYYKECGGDIGVFTNCVSDYYESHEQEILQHIESQLSLYIVDNESKATLREALGAHEHGYFRLVCRGLAPDIEKVIRENWLGIEKIRVLKEKEIEKAFDSKDLEDVLPDNLFNLALFGRLLEHYFKFVKDRADVKHEKLPNRHAALHGWVAYSSRQNSLNTIIFADYIFRLSAIF